MPPRLRSMVCTNNKGEPNWKTLPVPRPIVVFPFVEDPEPADLPDTTVFNGRLDRFPVRLFRSVRTTASVLCLFACASPNKSSITLVLGCVSHTRPP